MDPIAHTFTGAALAASGLRRVTPLATAALILGANAPDIDALTYFGGEYLSLAHRRGWTHGVLALGAFAVLTHPTLDWLNNYGLRWLMPFDGRWFYGDALFIVDPWVWLGLGGVLCLAHSRRAGSLAAWIVFWGVATLVVLGSGTAARPAELFWLAGVAVVLGARATGLAAPARERAVESGARAALVALVVYSAAAALANVPAKRAVRAELAERGTGPIEQIMIGPVPANPFAGDVVVVTPTAYHFGRWDWLGAPRLTLARGTVARPDDSAPFRAAAATLEARRFLTWSRFPYVEIETSATGHVVRFSDARYRSRDALGGPTVRLDAALEPVAVD